MPESFTPKLRLSTGKPPASRPSSAFWNSSRYTAIRRGSTSGGIGARLERWQKGGTLGWVLDNDEDALRLDARFAGFDMTDVLDHPEVRTPMMLYLFHRIAQRVDGRRLVLDIDEFWKVLGDPAFTELARDGLKTWRKQNALMVFGTQSPADALRSPIAHTILEQCATKIFLPNAHGQARDYVEGFGLSEEEFARLSSPIGLDLGARTPEETAISIAAEFVAERWGGSGRPLAERQGRIHHSSEG